MSRNGPRRQQVVNPWIQLDRKYCTFHVNGLNIKKFITLTISGIYKSSWWISLTIWTTKGKLWSWLLARGLRMLPALDLSWEVWLCCFPFSFFFFLVSVILTEIENGQWTPEGRKIGTKATGSMFAGRKQILIPPILSLCSEWHCHLQELNGRLVDTSKLGKTGERQINTVKELEKLREKVRALCVLVSQAQAVWRNNSLEILNCKDCELQMYVS